MSVQEKELGGSLADRLRAIILTLFGVCASGWGGGRGDVHARKSKPKVPSYLKYTHV